MLPTSLSGNLDRPYPEWFVEGYAELFSTPKFERNGSLFLGRPDQMRAWGLFNGLQLPLETLWAGVNSAIAYLNGGKDKEPRATLIVIAYSPQVPRMVATARQMIADIDAGKPRAALMELRAGGR